MAQQPSIGILIPEHICNAILDGRATLEFGEKSARVHAVAKQEPGTCCPECGSSEIRTTCMGFIGGRDQNRASCRCGWNGRAYQLAAKGNDA